MKKIYSLFLAGLTCMSISSCSDSSYDEKYQDPSKTETVSVPQVFTGVLYKGNVWMNLHYYSYYTYSSTSGLFSGVVGDNNSKGRYQGATEAYFNNNWKDFYDMVTQFRLLEYTYNNLPDNQKPINEIFVHLARTAVYSQLHEVLSMWGDVPFSGAGMLWENGDYEAAKTACVYDDDVVLYKQILNDLKATSDYLGGYIEPAAITTLARQDYTAAAGNIKMWQKYVNSLRLRIALHLSSNGDCVADAHAAIKEILENPGKYPVIDNNDENMGVKTDNQSDDWNYGKRYSSALHTGTMGNVSVAMLKAMNVPANGVPDANTDPRIQVMCDPNPDGEYVSYDITKTNAQITQLEDEKRKEYISQGITSANYYCKVDSQAIMGRDGGQGNENLFSLWISAAEVSLSKAEAYLMGYGVAVDQAAAKANFVTGVTQSVEYYWSQKENSTLYKTGNDSYRAFRPLVKPSDAEIAAYIENIWKPTQEAICTQLWLNFGFLNENAAWNVVRRTGYPVVNFSRDTQISSYPTPPHRLPYTSDELTYNSENCQNAIKLNYSESTGYYTKLFWAKENYYSLIN